MEVNAYSTLGTLTIVSLDDLARFAFPTRWFETLWLYEHIVKIIPILYEGAVFTEREEPLLIDIITAASSTRTAVRRPAG